MCRMNQRFYSVSLFFSRHLKSNLRHFFPNSLRTNLNSFEKPIKQQSVWDEQNIKFIVETTSIVLPQCKWILGQLESIGRGSQKVLSRGWLVYFNRSRENQCDVTCFVWCQVWLSGCRSRREGFCRRHVYFSWRPRWCLGWKALHFSSLGKRWTISDPRAACRRIPRWSWRLTWTDRALKVACRRVFFGLCFTGSVSQNAVWFFSLDSVWLSMSFWCLKQKAYHRCSTFSCIKAVKI